MRRPILEILSLLCTLVLIVQWFLDIPQPLVNFCLGFAICYILVHYLPGPSV